MSGRFEFTSPGAEVTSALTDLLTRRKAEERQKLLDSLSVNADQRAAAESAERTRMNDASLKMNDVQMKNYQSEMASRKQQDDLVRLNAVLAGHTRGWSPDDDKSMDPGLLELGDKYGKWSKDEQTVDDTDLSSHTISRRVYQGTAEEQERERRRNATQSIITQLMKKQDPRSQQVAEYLMNDAAANDGVLSAAAQGMLAPPGRIRGVDANTKKLIDLGEATPGDTVVNIPHDPRELADRSPRPVGKDAEGHIVYARPDGTEYTGTTVTGADPGDAPLGIPLGMYNSHLNQASVIAGFEGKIDPTDLARYRLSAHNVIQSAKGPTNRVKQIAFMAVNNPIAANEELKKGLTDAEMNQWLNLKTIIAPPSIEPILWAHPEASVKATPPKANPSAATTPNKSLEDVMKLRVGNKLTVNDIWDSVIGKPKATSATGPRK